MANMFGLPDIPIGDEANANHVRSRYSHNIIVGYPTEEDWRRLYDNLVVHEIALYTSMRQSHQRSVSTQRNYPPPCHERRSLNPWVDGPH